MRRRVTRYRGLVKPGTAWRWWAVVAFAVVVSGLEALGAVLIYTLTSLATDPGSPIALPGVGDLRERLPGLDPAQLVAVTAIGVGIFFVVRGAAVLAQTYTQVRVANAAAVDLATGLLERYLTAPYAFHLQRNSSALIRNATESVSDILNTILVPAVRLFAESVLALVLLGVLLTTAPLEALLATAVLLPVIAVVLRAVQPRIGAQGAIKQREGARSIRLLQHGLHGYRDVTLLGRREHFTDAYRTSREIVTRTGYLRATYSALPKVIIEAVVVGLIAVFLAVSVRRGDAAQSLAIVGLFGYAALRLIPALEKLTKNLNDLRFGRAALDDVLADLETLVPGDRGTPPPPLPFRWSIEVDRVSFTHPGNEEPTLRDVSVTLSRGSSLGIVGTTGAGKSTLIDLLVGLVPPTTGAIRVDGVPITGNEAAWHQRLGLVSQDVFLLDETLRRNVALGLPDHAIDDDAVREALGLAQLGPLLADLPDGLDTPLGERGTRLSGGQRQRISIARALYRRPEVLVFDEGTAALDNTTEAELIRTLSELRDDHTIITVAHRLTTVRDHDLILYLDAGAVVAAGSYDHLLDVSSGFRQLAREQDGP